MGFAPALAIAAAIASGIGLFAALYRPTGQRFPADPAQARFPEVKGRNLNGRQFTLPKDLEGEANLIFVAYKMNQQDDVNTWLPLAKELQKSKEGLRFYELPTLPEFGPAMQSYTDNGMRSGIRDQETRHLTITLYIDRESFLKALHIPNMDAIHALLVNRKGEILWRSEGRLDAEKEASLRAALG